MKKIITLLIICGCHIGHAQDCTGLYYAQSNKTVEVTTYNKKGNENGKQVYTVSEVNKAGSTVTSTVNSEMFDKNGKTVAKASNKIQCDNGIMMMDMKMFIPAQQMEQMKNSEVTGTASYLEYPSSMNIGDKLKDGKFNMAMTNNGLPTTLDMDMTDRFVQAKEKITSPAGSWDAFKITYNSKVKMKIAGIGIPVNMEVTEWYVPDFGIVKTESKYGSTLLTSIK